MAFDCRLLEEGDYENILTKWWHDWRWAEPPAKDSLPQDGLCGLMISKDGVNICAGFIFLTNSKTAWCEYIISNFEYKEDDRGEAIEMLIHTLSAKCGYKFGSKGCTEMIKIL